jgi:hypothetical protein
MRYHFLIIGRGKKSVKKKNRRQVFKVPHQVWNLEFSICLGFGILNFEFPLTAVRGQGSIFSPLDSLF